jgi:hypothetical protein
VPVHVSATLQPPPAERHTVVAGANASAGQAADVPLHVSAASQTPVDARHTVVVGLKPSAGHVFVVPSQLSDKSQGPFATRQTFPTDATLSVGHVRDVPSQVSATSQASACARQTVPLKAAEQVPTVLVRLQTPHPPSHAVSQQTPLTQKPVLHSSLLLQGAASSLKFPMQLPVAQIPDEQSLPSAHEVLQLIVSGLQR